MNMCTCRQLLYAIQTDPLRVVMSSKVSYVAEFEVCTATFQSDCVCCKNDDALHRPGRCPIMRVPSCAPLACDAIFTLYAAVF